MNRLPRIANSVEVGLSEAGERKRLSILLPASASTVCILGPYIDRIPESFPNEYRAAIEGFQIFQVSEIQGYLVYLNKNGSVVGSDLLTYTVSGFRLGGAYGINEWCWPVAATLVGVRVQNNAEYMYLTKAAE